MLQMRGATLISLRLDSQLELLHSHHQLKITFHCCSSGIPRRVVCTASALGSGVRTFVTVDPVAGLGALLLREILGIRKLAVPS